MTAEQVEAAIRPTDPYSIQTALICIENTHNAGGGTIYPLATIQAIRAVASAHGLPMHLDGARLFNAVVASGIAAADYARHFETVTFCLSKGLGAPAGSLIATDDLALLERLRRFRRMYGGAMRQSGILAAAGLYALEHHVHRLAEDHAHAKRLAERLAQIPAISINPPAVETNIVFFDLRSPGLSAPAFVSALRQEGVLLNAVARTPVAPSPTWTCRPRPSSRQPTPSHACSPPLHIDSPPVPSYTMHARDAKQRGMSVTAGRLVSTHHPDPRPDRYLGHQSRVGGNSPLPESPGIVRKLPNGKLEIIVDADQPFDTWLGTLEQQIRRVQAA